MATKQASTTSKKVPAKKISTAKTSTTTVTSAPVSATKNTFIGHVQESVRSTSLWRSLGAELFGTFLLAGVILATQGAPLYVMFAFVGIILMIGAVSGAHVNPAITIGAFVTRRIGWLRAVGYIIAQLLGAALAFVAFSAFINGAASPDAAQQMTQQAPALFAAVDVTTLADKQWFVFFSELIGTAILGFAIANVIRIAKDGLTAAFTGGLGLLIGLVIAFTAAGYVGGTAILNPAAAISLQAYAGLSTNLWPLAVYALAPILGAIIGFVLNDIHYRRVTN